MRFAYIDSQGNEVPIPSVDALALRIELGAIGPDTQLYDAQADRWGPASSHEIFHTLSRDAQELEEGFVAPPPAVPPPEPPPAAPPAGEAPAEPSAAEPAGESPPAFDLSDEFLFETGGGGGAGGGEDASDEGDFSVAGPGPVVTGGDNLGMDLDLTLTDSGSGSASAGEEAAAEPSQAAPEGPAGEEPAEEEAFDFGGFGALELEPTAFGERTPPAESPGAGTPAPGEDVMSFGASDASGEGDEALDFPARSDLGGGLEFEQPMSEFTPESPPAWMEGGEKEEPGAEGAMQFGSGQASPPEEAERKAARGQRPPAAEQPARERPVPRNRPSPPRRVKKRSLAGPIVGVVVVAAVAGGGWYGWQWYQARAAAQRAAEAQAATPPPVAIPDIPAELLPKMRELGNAALSGTITRLTDLERTFRLPAEPPSDWLAGIYMANASKYSDVQTYWQGIHSFVDSARSADAHIFHEEYVKQLSDAGISGDTASMLLERADSGFAATRQDRWDAYSLMEDLVNASLNLHQFLLDNEAEIDYDPAAGGVSRDPVLEAVPKTKALGTEMWGKVDQITTALDSLGTLDKVTTERLTAVLFDRIQRAGFH